MILKRSMLLQTEKANAEVIQFLCSVNSNFFRGGGV